MAKILQITLPGYDEDDPLSVGLENEAELAAAEMIRYPIISVVLPSFGVIAVVPCKNWEVFIGRAWAITRIAGTG